MGIVWTLRSRGMAPSMGAGGSLVVAGLCCLLFATALLSFRDWPGRGEASREGTITMPVPAGKAAGRAASGPAAAPVAASATASAAPARSRSAAAPARRPASRRGGSAPPVPAGVNRPATTSPAPSPAAGSAPAAAQPAPAAAPAPPARPQAQQPGPGPVEGVVETVRGVQEPLPLPPVVRAPAQPVLDTVQEVGRTVDQTAGSLLPTLP